MEAGINLKYDLEHTVRRLMDEPRNAYQTVTVCQTSDGKLGDASNFVT